jgi:hypothetical protein
MLNLMVFCICDWRLLEASMASLRVQVALQTPSPGSAALVTVKVAATGCQSGLMSPLVLGVMSVWLRAPIGAYGRRMSTLERPAALFQTVSLLTWVNEGYVSRER